MHSWDSCLNDCTERQYKVSSETKCLIMVERSAISIFAMAFIYLLIWLPTLTHERVHLQKATAVSLFCALSWPGASNCRLPSRSPTQLCWDWFLPQRKLKRKSKLGQKTASLIKSFGLGLVPLFPSLLPLCPLVSAVPDFCGSSNSDPIQVVAFIRDPAPGFDFGTSAWPQTKS